MELLKELFRYRLYKSSQGRLIRRLTMVGVWVLFATAAWKCTLMDFTWVADWYTWLSGWNAELKLAQESGTVVEAAAIDFARRAFVGVFVPVFTYLLAGLIALFGVWFGYRLVNWVTFADFLISVEGEMAKVSWPGKAELRSATIVVLIVFLFLAAMLLTYDLILLSAFNFIGVQ
jgi:preprotein translocase SecE subunit